MKRLSILLVVSTVVAASAQQRPPTVGAFFDEFTAQWMRANPNLAASTRYFSGAEQDAFERQLSPETAAFRQGMVPCSSSDRSMVENNQVLMMSCACGRTSMGKTRRNRTSSSS